MFTFSIGGLRCGWWWSWWASFIDSATSVRTAANCFRRTLSVGIMGTKTWGGITFSIFAVWLHLLWWLIRRWHWTRTSEVWVYKLATLVKHSAPSGVWSGVGAGASEMGGSLWELLLLLFSRTLPGTIIIDTLHKCYCGNTILVDMKTHEYWFVKLY